MTREAINNSARGEIMNTNERTGNYTPEIKKAVISDDMWLNYFNDFLYEKGIITSDEQRKMSECIMKRYPISGIS